MAYAQLVFSPTGGTMKVAQAITKGWGAEVSTIDLTDAAADFSRYSFTADDLTLIAIPSFGGRVSALAAQRLSQVKGNGARCVLTCVYGNRAYEDTLVELQDIAEQCGFQVLAAMAAVAEHSIMHQYAAGRPDSQDEAALHDFSQKILAKFRSGDQSSPTKKREALDWFPRLTDPAWNAACARSSARLRPSAPTASEKRTERSAFPVCAVWSNARTRPGRSTGPWWRRPRWP